MASTLPSLLSQALLDDHEEILKTANEQLKVSKKDRQALHARAVALLKLDRYDDALKTFEDSDDQLKTDAPLEYAYALYKTGQMKDAEKVAGSASGERGFKHMLAQAAYRSERFERARELYAQLVKEPGDEEGDLRINGGAANAQLAWSGYTSIPAKFKAGREDLQHFETAFNAACNYIARGEVKQAATLINRAKEDLSRDEKATELLPILVQQVYVLSRLSQHEEAFKLASSINVLDIHDKATRHIAQTNKLVASPDTKNFFMAHRAFNSTAQIPMKDRPFEFQSSILQNNALALDLQIGKQPASSQCKGTNEPEFNLSPTNTTYGVFKAAAKSHGQTGKIAARQILPLLEKNPEDLGLLLTVVHLYLLTKNTHMAATLLESFLARIEVLNSTRDLDIRFAPGLVALQVSLDAELNRTAHTKQELAKAASYWRHRNKSLADHRMNLSSLFAIAGLALLDMPTAEDQTVAQKIFRDLHEQEPISKIAMAGLAASGRMSNDKSMIDASLRPVTDLISGVDAAALEETGIAKNPASSLTMATSKKRPATDKLVKSSKPKRIRDSRKPKDFDPEKKMDPERWFPLRDRSTYRPKGKKKNKAQGMSTQGGLVSDESRPATPSQILQQPIKQNTGGKGKKKGKR